MKKFIKNTFYAISIIFIILISALLFLFTSTLGTNLLVKYFNTKSEYKIILAKPKGALLGNFQAEKVLISGSGLKVTLDNITFNTKINTIFSKKIFLNLKAKNIYIDSFPDSKTTSTNLWPYPFSLIINKFETSKLIIKPLNINLSHLILQSDINAQLWKIHNLNLTYNDLNIHLNGSGSTLKPYFLQTSLKITPQFLKDFLLSLQVNGDLNKYYLKGNVTGRMQATVTGKIIDSKFIESEINWINANFKEYNFQSPIGHVFIKGEIKNLDLLSNLKLTSPLNANIGVSAKLLKNLINGTSTIELEQDKITGNFNYSFNKPNLLNLAIGDNDFEINKLKSFTHITGRLNNLGQIHDKLQGLNTTGILEATVRDNKTNIKLNISSGNFKTGDINIPNITFDKAQISAQLLNNAWDVTGFVTEKAQTLNINAKGSVSPLRGNVSITGNELKLIDTSEYLIYATPNLVVDFTPDNLAINGEIYIPQGEIKPVSFSESTALTSDAKFVNHKKKYQKITKFNQNINVNLKMGEKVKLNIKGLQGLLKGQINIIADDHLAPIATGTLNVEHGKYEAYGQNLTIEKGELTFNDELIANPHVYIRAVRYFNNLNQTFAPSNQLFDFNPDNIQTFTLPDNLTVGIEVTGRLQATKIHLISIPATLSDADILSMLLLGKPANQAGSSGGKLLMTAVSTLDLGKGAKGAALLTQLKDKLGIDIDIQNISTYNKQTNTISDTTALVLGKSLTKRLYLSYNIGLFEDDINVLTLRYLLNKFFIIQVTSSSVSNGIDFLYTRSKDSLWPIL